MSTDCLEGKSSKARNAKKAQSWRDKPALTQVFTGAAGKRDKL